MLAFKYYINIYYPAFSFLELWRQKILFSYLKGTNIVEILEKEQFTSALFTNYCHYFFRHGASQI